MMPKELGRNWVPYTWAEDGGGLLHVTNGATETHCGKRISGHVGDLLLREPRACVVCRRAWDPVLLAIEDIWQVEAAHQTCGPVSLRLG